ncbi:cytochrome c1 [Psychrosphaera sp. B3R10]|uniref:Cytochrome c1 n=1 Tax=Psychrosphaera algicola TaxID=3023714 RepID=A0ABT5FH35_9GAMM|nr:MULTISPECIES: cytochrome c1 [unclassified Psychrosphaera]MBU2881946.1 cytochrome c1 [Psychrosphaera sp. I2R16]MBU2991257.1 cytochrome c1 [Psychrosphaera sp. B3R10]MDC2890508.1 cytochrome c1 [Psychrosphaera sp. G1-22]MDO6720977.1 cytochrome c1 [Psychrosphaera sp. 1_MG-2023]
MKKFIKTLGLLVGLVSTSAFSAGGGHLPYTVDIDLTDKASLQNGAKTFMNYCLGCHQMQYQRYERTFNDLGIPLDLGLEHLVFTKGTKIGEHIKNAMPADDAKKWFGATPPDLTLEARLRGPDWIYSYLKSFYVDPSRPFNVNNTVFKDVGMPHVLQELQGVPTKQEVFEERLIDGEMKRISLGEQIVVDGSGELSEDEYDVVVRDLTNFMVYIGEPMILERESMGWKAMLYSFIFFVFAVLLKKEYWRDIKK